MPSSLGAIGSADLQDLLQRLNAGAVSLPLTRAGLASTGLTSRGSDWTALLALGLGERTMLMALIEAVLAERARPVPEVDLVWTGPETAVSTARRTATVVRELFATANTSVLVAGFRFDHGEELLAPLQEAMSARGVRAAFFLDVASEPGLGAWGDASPDDFAKEAARRFLERNWPFAGPRPALYYAPHTFSREAPASLHAKCVVVDGLRTLVGSANFTDRGQTRNIEVGVAITDARFAREVSDHFSRALAEGVFRLCASI